MKKLLLLLLSLALISSPALAQIALDGDDSDWSAEPLLVEAVDNVDGFFPSEVGAAVTDNVDVKEIKAKIVGNVFYFLIRFQGGPVWPNMADQREHEGTPINRSRGYYHLMLDLDNDAATGWDSHYYEAHYTPVGYLASQGITPSDKIGAEVYLMWGGRGWFTAPHPDSGGIKNSGIKEVEYFVADVSEIISETDAGADYSIYGAAVSNTDSAKGLAWSGTLPVMDTDDPFLEDGRSYWVGHAWGFDFLEYGIELSVIQQYWENKGMSYFGAGDVIGLAAMIETPADDWGVDLTSRGEITCPEMPVRPNSITFDGEDFDWASLPTLVEAVDNVDGFFPSEVGAAVTDNVDVKEIKGFINTAEGALYWFVRFWGGPAWPNMADQREHEGTPINRSRGYYHLMLDLDNDATTGWDSHFYEAHYTPVGYLASQGITPSDKIGAEVYMMWGGRGWFTAPHPDSGGIKNPGIKEVEYYAADVSEIISETDAGADYDIYWTEVTDPDSAIGLAHDGMLPVMESDDASLVDDVVHFNAHAWGHDFMEVGQCIDIVKQYWANKGMDYFNEGDVIGIAAMIETPADDWGVDLTPRGQLGVTALPARPSAITFDGDDSDWDEQPVLVDAVDNVDGFFPSEVGAAVTDNVDVKEIKAFVEFKDDMIYWFVRFWGGPAWPNMADQREHEGTPINRSRGYYHLMMDLDNDATTGWDSHFYEAHYTPVGYLASQGITPSDKIGAEVYLMWGGRGWFTAPHPDSGGIKNSGIKQVEYYVADVSEIISETDAGADYGIYGSAVANPDSAIGLKHLGLLPVMESDDPELVTDQLYWNGHAWGHDFLEMGQPISLIRQYWANKGMDVFKNGDEIGIAAMIETPADDWGVDLTPRGSFLISGAIPPRPKAITFDGDDSDWAAHPILVDAVDNVDGFYPSEVGAAVTDNVDVKEIKAFVEFKDDMIYWFVRFWGGPAWPNMADQREHEGTPINRSRGYYHLMMDLDNDATTGWDSHFYEAHYTPVGYLASQGITPSDKIGAEVYLMWGGRGWFTAPHPDSGGIKNSGIKQIEYYVADVSEIISETDAGADYGIYGTAVANPDSAKGLKNLSLQTVMESDDPELVTDQLYWNAHAWGHDFLEMGQPLSLIQQYWKNKGIDVFQEGDEVGIAAMIETPADDWGVDLTPRGAMMLTTNVDLVGNSAVPTKFALGNNYPNPFNPTTTIRYAIPEHSKVKLVIYNSLGQKVRTLIDRSVTAGNYSAIWDGTSDAGLSLASGVYFYRLKMDSKKITKKMLLVK